jgi:hypothetical protein
LCEQTAQSFIRWQILDTNPALYFHLQQQRLIELIRQGRVDDALVFAQQELAPRGEEHPEFLAELERTMALLAFDSPSPSSATLPTFLAAMLHPAHRQRTAGELNAAILISQSHGPKPKLPGLLSLLAWGEGLLEERADFPRLDLGKLLGHQRDENKHADEEMVI